MKTAIPLLISTLALSLTQVGAKVACPACGPVPIREAPTFRFFKAMVSETSLPDENYALYPKTFSATGFFSDPAAKVVGPGIYPFEINSPLWNDGAVKSRFLVLPKDSVITFVNDTDEYLFPEGATFVKHFMMDTLKDNPASRIYLETRIMVRQYGKWHGFSYKWRKDQSDADLIGEEAGGGETDSLYVRDASGNPRKKKWLFPARSGPDVRGFGLTTCNSCHVNGRSGRQRGILGFITPQLTRLANGKDQIQDLMDKGYLVKRAGAAYIPSAAHRWYALDDSASPGSTLEKRARSYLASNCSHCHSPEGNISCTPVYTYATPGAAMNYMDKVSRGAWGVTVPAPDSAKWIFPGKPDYSVILRRISAADPDGYRDTSLWDVQGNRRALAKVAGWDGNGKIQMPPLGTYEINPLANEVIRAWIMSLPPGYTGAAIARGMARSAGTRVRLENGRLYLPEDMTWITDATLSGLQGKRIALSALRGGVFSMPTGLEHGIYVLTAGRRTFAFAYLAPR